MYFLRDHRSIAEKLEAVLLDNLLGRERIRNPRLVLVANRLAEMSTRKEEKKSRDASR